MQSRTNNGAKKFDVDHPRVQFERQLRAICRGCFDGITTTLFLSNVEDTTSILGWMAGFRILKAYYILVDIASRTTFSGLCVKKADRNHWSDDASLKAIPYDVEFDFHSSLSLSLYHNSGISIIISPDPQILACRLKAIHPILSFQYRLSRRPLYSPPHRARHIQSHIASSPSRDTLVRAPSSGAFY